MEIDLEIYSHLIKAGVVEGGINNPAHKVYLDLRKVLLDKDTSILFENGVAFARYMIYIKRKLETMEDEKERKGKPLYKIDEQKLTELRASVTPSIRLHNWNIIIKELVKLGVKVNADMKSLLVAGDYGIINEYIRSLYSLEQSHGGGTTTINQESHSPPKKATEDNSYKDMNSSLAENAIDIGELDSNKRLVDTTSCLEFLLNILGKSFKMNPKQSAGLLTNQNKYLDIAIIKGLKENFDPVLSLYQEVYANSKHLTGLIDNEHSYNLNSNTLSLVLNAFKAGFLSQNEEVVNWCCRLFAKVAHDFIDSGEIIGVAWDWFVNENQGALETCLQAIRKYQSVMENMVPVFINFARFNFAELFTHHFRKYVTITADYLNLIHELIEPLNETKFSRDELLSTGTLDFLIEHCILKADTTGGQIDTTKNDRQAALCLLCTLWGIYPEKFEKDLEATEGGNHNNTRLFQHLKSTAIQENQNLAAIALIILKRNCRDKTNTVRMVALSQLFRLLDQFSQERNQYAPILYKTLIFSLIENHSNELMRQHVMTNFLYLFERINTIPVGILVDPLVKQIYMSEGITYKFNIFDFDFFTAIAKHPRLNIKNAIQVLDLMAKAYLNEHALDYQTSSAVPLMLIVTRFLDHQATQEFIIKFVTIAITMMNSVEQELAVTNAQRRHKIIEFEKHLAEQQKVVTKAPKKKQPPEEDLQIKLKGPEETSEEVETRVRQLIRRHRVIDIIKKLVQYRNQDLNDEIKVALLSAFQKYIEINREESKGIAHLLDWWWGKPQQLLQDYVAFQQQKTYDSASTEHNHYNSQSDMVHNYSQFDTRSEDISDTKFAHPFKQNQTIGNMRDTNDRQQRQQMTTPPQSKNQVSIMMQNVVGSGSERHQQHQNSQKQEPNYQNNNNMSPRANVPPLQLNRRNLPEVQSTEAVRPKQHEVQMAIQQRSPQTQHKPAHRNNSQDSTDFQNILNKAQRDSSNRESVLQQENEPKKTATQQSKIKTPSQYQQQQPQQQHQQQQQQLQPYQNSFQNNEEQMQPKSKPRPTQPQRHNYEDFQAIQGQKQLEQSAKPIRGNAPISRQMSDTDNKPPIHPKKNSALPNKMFSPDQPPNKSLVDQRNLSLPMLPQAKSVQQLKPFKQAPNLEMSPDQVQVVRGPKTSTNVNAQSQIALRYQTTKNQPIEDVNAIQNKQQIMLLQQKLNESKKSQNTKSQVILQNKDLLQQMPYDNYLSQKKVDVPTLKRRPKDKKVLFEIEKINQKKQEKAYKKYMEEQIKGYRDQKQKQQLSQELERRKLELGIAPSVTKRRPLLANTRQSRKRWKSHNSGQSGGGGGSEEDNERNDSEDSKMDVVILDEGETLPSARIKMESIIPPMQCVDINTEEEDRDRVNIVLWLAKYSKLFKILFNKYANTVRNIVDQNFDYKDQKSKFMNMGEILKFAKDHNIYPELLSKDEISSLVRLMNIKRKKPEEINQLDFETFQNFFIQMAHNIYFCKQQKVQWLLIDQIEFLLKHMQKHVLYKGGDTNLFEDPEYVIGLDRQKLTELNQQIQEDPNMEVPDGFYKVYERQMVYDYSLPDYLPIKESTRIATETLDNLLFDIFGLHTLEARACPKVLPKIKQNEQIAMGKHRQNLNEIKSKKRIKSQVEASKAILKANKMTDFMKTEVQYILDTNGEGYQKQELEQVGLCLDALMSRVVIEHELEEVANSKNPKILNKLQQDKLREKAQANHSKKMKDSQWFKHEKEVKEKLSYLQQVKEAKDYDNKKSVKDQEFLENEKRKALEEKRRKEFELKKIALEEKKQRDMDELQRQKEEENEKKRKQNEIKAQIQKEFLKMQKQKLKETFNTKVNDRKELKTVQKQVEGQAKEKFEKIKQNMVSYITETKEQRKQEEEKFKEDIERFTNEEGTQKLFQRYDKGLRQYFKYFAIQDKQNIEFNLESKNETLNMNKFIKFGYQSNIYPTLISHDDLAYIFRLLVKENSQANYQAANPKTPISKDELEMLHVIDYEHFKKGIIRIASMAQDRLLGSSSPNHNKKLEASRMQSRSQQRLLNSSPNNFNTTNHDSIRNTSLSRKTKEVKQIKMLQDSIPKYDTKIEDKTVAKRVAGVETLEPRSVENLFHFLDIGEGDSTTVINNKIHQTRLEISGQKPTKVKKEGLKRLINQQQHQQQQNQQKK